MHLHKIVKQVLFYDCAVSLLPAKWVKQDKISEKHYKKTGRLPLVNASSHQHLLKNIPQHKRNDRPDILHFALLLTLDMVKLSEERVDIMFTIGKKCYKIKNETRIPRSQLRFYGILEQLLLGKSIKFITQIQDSLETIIKKNVWVFTKKGKFRFSTQTEAMKDLTIIYGAQPHKPVTGLNSFEVKEISIASQSLELSTAIAFTLPRIFKGSS